MDKVQKIREEVESRYNYHKDHADDYAGTEHFWKAVEDRELLSFIDSMQGKQVDYGKLKTSLDDALSKETKESWEKFLQEEEKTSVWHDPKDSPKHGSIIVINNDQTTLSVEYVGQPLDGVDKWAYLDELLKL